MMNKFVYILILLFYGTVYSQAIPQEVKSTVCFIYAKDPSGNLIPNGTGFFVGVKDTTRDRSAVYLVTAKHVLVDNKKEYFQDIYLRLNTKDSLSKVISLALHVNGRNKNTYFHKDSTVDIAVIPALPNDKIFDYLFLSDDFLVSQSKFKELNIMEGTEVFFTGLFTPFIGDKRNYPVVRFGRVALVTDEKIPWDGVKTNMYLIESSSYGGNSGAPVFFNIGINRGDGNLYFGKPILMLAGIMKGFFGQKTPIEVVNTNSIPVSVNNIGIAAVTPSYLLQEILFSDELKKLRGF